MAAGGVKSAVAKCKAAVGGRFGVQVEVEDLDELQQAIDAGADAVLLDNMDDTACSCVALADGRVLLEASGGMTACLPRLDGIGLDQ